MTYKVKIFDSILTKTAQGYPCIKIKCKKDENGRIVYSNKNKNKNKKQILKFLITLQTQMKINNY